MQGEKQSTCLTENDGGTEKLQSRRSRRNGPVSLRNSLGKDSAVIDERPEELEQDQSAGIL